jgi:DNA adenine methylase
LLRYDKDFLDIIRDLEYNRKRKDKGVVMLSFISAKEAAEKWNISQRRVSVLCSENRINGAMMVGNMWIIPSNAEKPVDKRTVRYEKAKDITLKPFVKWVGGKSQLVDEIEKMLPADGGKKVTKYAEPMVGGGALFFSLLSKYDFEEMYISDINAELINAYQVVKNDAEGLIAKLNEMQMLFLPMDENGRKYFYYAVRERFNSTALSAETATDKAAEFIFLNKTCFNGLYRVNRKGQFNVPMGAYKNPSICDDENLRNIHEALRNVTIVCGDYSLSKSFIDKNTFVYIDPPYRPISATSGFTAYNTDVFDDNEQIRLSRFIDELNLSGAKIVLSNSDPKNVNKEDNFFDDLYKNYKINRVEASRAINSKGDKRGKINELLICN